MAREVLRVNGLSKVYRLYSKSADRFKEFFVKGDRHINFAALDSVSFLIREGETVGIIGENGAGKSTLLQLIAGTLFSYVGRDKSRGESSCSFGIGDRVPSRFYRQG